MKLLFTLDFPPRIGGIQKYLYGIARFCYNEDDMVFIGGVTPDPSSHPHLKVSVKYRSSPLDIINRKLSLLLFIPSYLQLCRQKQGNLVVECGNIYAAFVPWLLSRVTGQTYRIYTYGTELVGLHKPTLKNILLKSILLGAEKLYTLGKYTQDILFRINPNLRTEVVPPRIILPASPPVQKKRNSAVCTILCVGRLVPHKGHANLIRAAAILSQERACRFIIAGNGPQLKPLITLCNEMKAREYVSIKHRLTDEQLRQEFSNADIFVLPSLETPAGTEGFGIVLLEAMLYRLPIIASATGGIPEVLDNSNCGLLVEPGNVEQLVQAVLQIADNSRMAKKLVHKAHERLLAHYVW